VIAIMEGNRSFQRVIRDHLEGAGYQPVVWSDLLQASEGLTRHVPDLVILDLVWEPGSTGLSLLALLRRDPATWALPVIVCSDDADYLRQSAPRLRGKGCTVLPKPFALKELLALVRALIGPGAQPPRPAPEPTGDQRDDDMAY
jgi:DNA-binding response OmpR family regulator